MHNTHLLKYSMYNAAIQHEDVLAVITLKLLIQNRSKEKKVILIQRMQTLASNVNNEQTNGSMQVIQSFYN